MKKILKLVVNTGTFATNQIQENQRIRFGNTIALINLAFIAIIFGLLLYQYGFKVGAKLVLVTTLIPLLSLLFNKWKFYAVARYWISNSIPIGIVAISIITKISNPVGLTGFYEFFDTRMLLLVSAIIPLILFSSRPLVNILVGLLPSALLLFLYDPIHHFFNVGFTDLFYDPNDGYYIAGILFDISYLFAALGILSLKRLNEKLIEDNSLLIEDLNSKNQIQEKILKRKQTLLAQNEDINNSLLKKQEEILESQKQLKLASDLIKEQKYELEYKNIELKSKVEERTRALKQANDELIVQNNGLLQFSNTVSHNLRAPVASLLGLVHLFEIEEEESRKMEMLSHIKSSSVALDTVISDLNKVVDIRNQLYHLKENIDLKGKVIKVEELLKIGLNEIGAIITLELKVKNIYFIRSYMHSILYNLISNAIKYSKPNDRNIITVLSFGDSKSVTIEVMDKGMGIDLVKFGNDIFKMHKRFHTQIDGKGMGLYLVKQQVEAMNGKITVESEPEKGTKFVMKFPIQKQVNFQEYYKSPYATISYDASLKTSVLVWSQTPDSVEYKNVLSINKEMFVNYNTKSWVIDVRNIGIISEEDRGWFASKVLGEIIKRGCKTIIVVKFETDGKDYSYWQKMLEISNSMGVLFKIFFDVQVALEYLEEKEFNSQNKP